MSDSSEALGLPCPAAGPVSRPSDSNLRLVIGSGCLAFAASAAAHASRQEKSNFCRVMRTPLRNSGCPSLYVS